MRAGTRAGDLREGRGRGGWEYEAEGGRKGQEGKRRVRATEEGQSNEREKEERGGKGVGITNTERNTRIQAENTRRCGQTNQISGESPVAPNKRTAPPHPTLAKPQRCSRCKERGQVRQARQVRQVRVGGSVCGQHFTNAL